MEIDNKWEAIYTTSPEPILQHNKHWITEIPNLSQEELLAFLYLYIDVMNNTQLKQVINKIIKDK